MLAVASNLNRDRRSIGDALSNKLCGRPPQYAPAPVTLTLKVVIRVTCDVCYLCANFRLPRPLCS